MSEEGPAVELRRLDESFVELRLDKKGDTVNALDTATRRELAQAVGVLPAERWPARRPDHERQGRLRGRCGREGVRAPLPRE